VTERKVVAVGAPPTFRHQVARALAVDPESIDWMPSVSAAEAALGDTRIRPNVFALSPNIKEPDAFGLAEFVGRSSPSSAIVIVRDLTPNGLIPRAMRAGIRDVVDLSQGGDEFREALQRALAWSENLRALSPPEMPGKGTAKGTMVSVFSSKGGTGKTFLTANLGAALAEMTKEQVGLLDLEFGVGDVFSYFGKEPSRPLQDLLSIGDLTRDDDPRALGTSLLANLWGFGSAPDPSAAPVSGEAIGKVVRSLRSSFDYLLVDGTAEYSDPVLATFDLSDEICLITGLDVVSVRHLSLALQTLLSLGFSRDRFRIVLNRADSKVGLSPQDVERVTKIQVDAMLPSSRLVPISLNRGRPVVVEEPRSDIAKAIDTLAARFVPDSTPASEPKRASYLRRKKTTAPDQPGRD
jgi:pilus assembly protein CpaE